MQGCYLPEFMQRIEYPEGFDVRVFRGVPFDAWEERWQLAAWKWLGRKTSPVVTGGRWQRAKPQFRMGGRYVNPVTLIWPYMTGVDIPPGKYLIYERRGERGFDKNFVDVNPAQYRLPDAPGVTRRKNRGKAEPRARVLDYITALMAGANFWPRTVEELLARWPEFANERRCDLEATINV